MMTRSRVLVLAALLALMLGMVGCSGDDVESGGTIPEGPVVASCEGCHTNQEMLIAVAEPDVPVESEGEG
jgi:hypothetical protein